MRIPKGREFKFLLRNWQKRKLNVSTWQPHSSYTWRAPSTMAKKSGQNSSFLLFVLTSPTNIFLNLFLSAFLLGTGNMRKKPKLFPVPNYWLIFATAYLWNERMNEYLIEAQGQTEPIARVLEIWVKLVCSESMPETMRVPLRSQVVHLDSYSRKH